MQTLYVVWGQRAKWDPDEFIGVYDCMANARNAKDKAENAVCFDGSDRFRHVWIDKQILNQTMELD